MAIYKIYGNSKTKGYTKIDTKTDLEEALKLVEDLKAKEYYSYMIIENNGNGDNIVKQENLYKECEVEFVDNLKTKFEVKPIVFKPSRAKNKEELRKLTENYIER